MGSLYFPQLATGAMAQFPFSKTRSVRTVQNVATDGSMIVAADPGSARIVWNLRYNELSIAEMQTLQAFFAACNGPFSAFTFIDPASNMLLYSSDLTNAAWISGPNIRVTSGIADPTGGIAAFQITNTGQIAETMAQTIAVPANYQYCLSVSVQSAAAGSTITLIRSGSSASAKVSYSCKATWSRLVTQGKLNDAGNTLTVAVQLQPGQSFDLFAPQLEAQVEPSAYRSTSSISGVYPNSHWASNQLIFSANGPSSFATAFSIESVS